MDDLRKAAETTVPGLSPRNGRVLAAFYRTEQAIVSAVEDDDVIIVAEAVVVDDRRTRVEHVPVH